jgi:riboflavin synthase
MFTGLIQALGTLERSGDQLYITCVEDTAHRILMDLAIGDSVAVDGICLTVTEVLAQGFVAIASPETLHRTTLGNAQPRSWVNLEPSLRVGSKLGGHFVTGHVDGVGHLDAIERTATSWELDFVVEEGRVARYIVPKGSVAVNGVSLTVADCNDSGSWFKVAVIPHSYATTNLHCLQPGSLVNLEGDILGKYVEKLWGSGSNQNLLPLSTATQHTTPPSRADKATQENVSLSFLAEHGYL